MDQEREALNFELQMELLLPVGKMLSDFYVPEGESFKFLSREIILPIDLKSNRTIFVPGDLVVKELGSNNKFTVSPSYPGLAASILIGRIEVNGLITSLPITHDNGYLKATLKTIPIKSEVENVKSAELTLDDAIEKINCDIRLSRGIPR